MDKNKIKKFAINARKSLRDTTEVRLANLGITDEKINDELSISTKDKLVNKLAGEKMLLMN